MPSSAGLGRAEGSSKSGGSGVTDGRRRAPNGRRRIEDAQSESKGPRSGTNCSSSVWQMAGATSDMVFDGVPGRDRPPSSTPGTLCAAGGTVIAPSVSTGRVRVSSLAAHSVNAACSSTSVRDRRLPFRPYLGGRTKTPAGPGLAYIPWQWYVR
jgi:hypothetical protein